MTKFILFAVLTCGVSAVAQEPAPKRAGVVRIGVVRPKVDMGSGAGGSGEALRTLVSQYLSGPTVEVLPVQAMVRPMVEAEAKQKDLDFVLYATLTQQAPKKSGGLGLLKGARAMSGVVPVVGMSGRTGAVVAQAAAQTAISVASELSAGVKAKGEVSLEYELAAPGAGSPAVAKTEKVKAETDGQDVVTPMVERLATSVIGAAARPSN